MAGGYKSLLAPWIGGASSNPSAAVPNGGVRSLLAAWIGGASAPPGSPAANGGVRSLLAFWAGGATSGAVQPQAVVSPFYSGGWEHHPWLRKRKSYVEEQEIPEEVSEAIVAIAEKAIGDGASRKPQKESVDELREFLDQKKQEWKELYIDLIRIEYWKLEREYEDAQIALLLFEM